jgi:hypothetical protein
MPDQKAAGADGSAPRGPGAAPSESKNVCDCVGGEGRSDHDSTAPAGTTVAALLGQPGDLTLDELLDAVVADIVGSLGQVSLSSVVILVDGMLPAVTALQLSTSISRLERRGLLVVERSLVTGATGLTGREVRLRATAGVWAPPGFRGGRAPAA